MKRIGIGLCLLMILVMITPHGKVQATSTDHWKVGDGWTTIEYDLAYDTANLNCSIGAIKITSQRNIVGTTDIQGDLAYDINVTRSSTWEGNQSLSPLLPGGYNDSLTEYYSQAAFGLVGQYAKTVRSDGNIIDNTTGVLSSIPVIMQKGIGTYEITRDYNYFMHYYPTNAGDDTTAQIDHSIVINKYVVSEDNISAGAYTFSTYKIAILPVEFATNTSIFTNDQLTFQTTSKTDYFVNNTGYVTDIIKHDTLKNSTTHEIDRAYFDQNMVDQTVWISKQYGIVVKSRLYLATPSNPATTETTASSTNISTTYNNNVVMRLGSYSYVTTFSNANYNSNYQMHSSVAPFTGIIPSYCPESQSTNQSASPFPVAIMILSGVAVNTMWRKRDHRNLP